MSTPESGDNASANLSFESIPSQEDMNKELNAPAQAAAPVEQKTPAEDSRPDWLPDKFASPEDMAKSYGQLENELGRQRTEIGELRNLTTELAATRQTQNQPNESDSQPVPDLTADDVLNDPGKAIGSVVQREVQKALAPVTDSVANLEASLTMGEFQRRHPTFQADQNDPAFAAWVQGDALRKSFAARALEGANQGNLTDVDELFTQWEAYRDTELNKNEQTPEELAAEEAASAIAPSGGMSSDAPKNYIRRSDLDDIMINDRERYDSPAFQKWMQGKYEQGLVK